MHTNVALDEGARGGLLYFALDSRFTGGSGALANFYERGQPLAEALWWLSVAAPGPLTSPSLLTVDFNFQPSVLTLRQADGVTPYTREQIRSTIENFLRTSIIGGEVDATFDLFPSATNAMLPGTSAYAVTLGSDGMPITCGVGMNAGIIAVPEPASVLLMLCGALLVLTTARVGRASAPGLLRAPATA